MDDASNSTAGRLSDRPLPEAMARSLRHEFGDFLQKVYANVAILQARLPADMIQEREMLGRLRRQAEACRGLLDAVQDYICPVKLACEPLDLAGLTARLAEAARRHHPGLEILTEEEDQPTIIADPGRVHQIGQILLANACDSGGRRVVFRTTVDPQTREAVWSVSDDGAGMVPELADRLFEPFVTTRAGHAGLGLALARKLVDLHGGQITAGNRPGGGFGVMVRFPHPPPAPGNS